MALLETGEAEIGAGALEAALQCLRRAVADAMALGDGALTAQGFAKLGSALVHAARGSDEEGATALHRALICEGAEPATLAQTLCELAYVEFLHGRYDRVEVWLAQADVVTTDPAQRAIGLSVRGSTLSDQGRYSSALHALDEALGLADAVVFAVGAGPGSGMARKETVDRGAAVLFADAAERAGVRRYLMISAMARTGSRHRARIRCSPPTCEPRVQPMPTSPRAMVWTGRFCGRGG